MSIKNILSLALIMIGLNSGAVWACPIGTDWLSTSVLSTLLSGNPTLEVTAESTELKIRRNGKINLSATANIQSNSGGSVTMTGDAVIKAKGRYTLEVRNNKRFIKITEISADMFTTRLFINGELAAENEYPGLIFSSDRSIRYRCTTEGLQLIQTVNGTRRELDFSH